MSAATDTGARERCGVLSSKQSTNKVDKERFGRLKRAGWASSCSLRARGGARRALEAAHRSVDLLRAGARKGARDMAEAVAARDSDVTSWTVGISSGALREHLDLPCLARELDQWQRASQQQPVIVMSVRFPVDYPKSVPFVRMIKPRFKWHTGHVTVGGSMCTELLTPGGWQPMTVHALLLTVCQMLREGEAQIQLKPDEHCMWPLKDYSEMEAREAYERVAKFHGWPTQRRHS